MNFSKVLARHPQLFPQRIRIEAKGGTYNASGQRMGDGWSVAAGFETLLAQSAPPKRGSGSEGIRGEATHALAQRIWTLPGRVQGISPSQRLVEIDDGGAPIGAHDILAVEVHAFGLHTVIETKRAI